MLKFFEYTSVSSVDLKLTTKKGKKASSGRYNKSIQIICLDLCLYNTEWCADNNEMPSDFTHIS